MVAAVSQEARAALVVPVWNEAGRLQADAFIAFLEEQPDITVCFVDDGSTDGSAAVLQQVVESRPDRVEVLRQPVNRGKAEAVRAGLRWAGTAGYGKAAYLDADLAAPLAAALLLLTELERDAQLGLVLGSRVQAARLALPTRSCHAGSSMWS
jgi:glycosyltransferase involved in cell wall biosynthesis